MVAINKVNANFHHKFEEFSNILNNKENGVIHRLEEYETTIETILEALNDEQDGVLPTLRDAESEISDMKLTTDMLTQQNATLQDQVFMLRGTVQVHDHQIDSTAKKVVSLTARSMAQNMMEIILP